MSTQQDVLSTEVKLAVSIESKTICFTDKETVDRFAVNSGLESVAKFNELALMFLKYISPEYWAEMPEEEKAQWSLGATNKEVADHLFEYLTVRTNVELVVIN